MSYEVSDSTFGTMENHTGPCCDSNNFSSPSMIESRALVHVNMNLWGLSDGILTRYKICYMVTGHTIILVTSIVLFLLTMVALEY